jgi:hypothetical protein
MKTLLLLAIGIFLGIFMVHVYDRRNETAAPGTLDASIDGKLAQWHLTSDDIKADLAQTGKVVRTNANVAGAKIDDARIMSVIKAKYVLDRDISAMDISVDVTNGHVVLGGRVASTAIIGRAIELALDTDGVSSVSSELAIRPLN